MKFDPDNWQEVKANETFIRKGVLRVRASKPVTLWGKNSKGREVPACTGDNFEVETSEEVTFRITGFDKADAVFVDRKPVTTAKPEGEVFTNLDNMPHESGAVLEVRKAMRQMQFQQQQMMAQMKAQARADAKAKAKAKDGEVIEPDKPADAPKPVDPPEPEVRP